jgi:predicted hotdog family 3-hydroxylacyl-ACP dehydratase
MCLIDHVEHWDAGQLLCRADCSRPNHPLRSGGKLPSSVAIEYAAQAAAIHGSLLGRVNDARPGYLVKLSNVALHNEYIEDTTNVLNIAVQLISRSDLICLYSFEVMEGVQHLAAGRLMIAFTQQPQHDSQP